MASDGTMDRNELNARFTGIEQNLQQLREDLKGFATKDDLKGVATKDDFKGFATKDDLKGFATKDDFKGFATKDDLKGFATKDDLKGFATKDDLKGFATKDDLKGFPTKDDLKCFATKDDLERYDDRNREMHAETRRHFEVVVEAHVKEIRLLAEGHGALVARADRTDARLDLVDRTVGTHDLRLTRVERLTVDPPG